MKTPGASRAPPYPRSLTYRQVGRFDTLWRGDSARAAEAKARRLGGEVYTEVGGPIFDGYVRGFVQWDRLEYVVLRSRAKPVPGIEMPDGSFLVPTATDTCRKCRRRYLTGTPVRGLLRILPGHDTNRVYRYCPVDGGRLAHDRGSA